MKKFLVLLTALALVINSFAAFTVEAPPKKASEIYITIGATGKQVSLMDLSRMSPKEYQDLTGQHLKLTEKLAFRISQRELRKAINPDGTINIKKLESLNAKMTKAPASGDNKRNLRLALIFAAVAVVLTIIGGVSTVGWALWTLASIAWLVAVVFFIIWLVNQA